MAIGILRIAVLAVGVALGANAWGADKFPCPKDPITMAFYESGAMYHEGKGLDIDLYETLKQRTGCSFRTSERPRARIWKEMESGQLDMATSAIGTPEREKFAHFVYYLRQKNMVLAGKSMPADMASTDQFLANPTLKWGVVRSFKHGPYYDDFVARLHANGRSTEAVDSVELLRMLKLDMVPGVLSVPLVYRHLLTDAELSAVRVLDWKKDDSGDKLGLIFSKARFSESEVQQWREVIDGMRRDGTMLRLLSKYLPPAEARAALLK
jgi:polar amino acid transport system substrate-binding protein